MGAFIQAAVEMEMLPTLAEGKGRTVLLDYYFNNEWKKDATGTEIRYHYTWDDKSNSGFSMLGNVFTRYGAQTKYLEDSPTTQNLKGSDIYIIVDPDTEKETRQPHYMNAAAAKEIEAWVKAGGALVLMGNDAGNAELKNFNILAAKFGIQFNEDNFNMVQNNQYEQGVVTPSADSPVFKTARKLYVKELATLQVNKPARAIAAKDGKNIIAIAPYGKGTVFVIGDPWIYNEYVDGRKLPADFENYKGAEDLVRWLIKSTTKKQ
jgi:unsaturated rhamnogalacturonyl hydrolase